MTVCKKNGEKRIHPRLGSQQFCLDSLQSFLEMDAIAIRFPFSHTNLLCLLSVQVTRNVCFDDDIKKYNEIMRCFLFFHVLSFLPVQLNFVFFMNIVRVLLLKLQSAVSIETRKYRYRYVGIANSCRFLQFLSTVQSSIMQQRIIYFCINMIKCIHSRKKNELPSA